MPDKPAISLQTPERKTIDVFLVQLPDGRTVARTRDELAETPIAPSAASAHDPRRI